MTPIEVISLAASIASLVLAILAIWLSIAFYKMSTEQSSKATKAAERISTSVEKLEKLFDSLYADTFTMMRDTVSDMRKHIWPDIQSNQFEKSIDLENKIDERIFELKSKYDKELSTILEHQSNSDSNISEIQTKVSNILDQVISGTRIIETETLRETLRDRIIEYFRQHGNEKITADNLVDAFANTLGVSGLFRELSSMRDEDLIDFSGKVTGIVPDTVFKPRRKLFLE